MSLQSPIFVKLDESRTLSRVPVVSFTQDLPPGTNADCLLLNCGDLRNVLLTIYCEESSGGLTPNGAVSNHRRFLS